MVNINIIKEGVIMGKFLVKQGKKGCHFVLKARNGKVIGMSQVFSSEEACIKSCASIARAVATVKIEDQTVEGFQGLTHPKFELYLDKKNEYRFRLLAKNGENILASEGYKTMASAKKGIASVVTNASSPVVHE